MDTQPTDFLEISLLKDILQKLVTYPDAIEIDRKSDDMGVLLSVKVHLKDMGIVIGRNGIMANAIKTVMKAVGKTHNMNLRVQFLEPIGSMRNREEEGHEEQRDIREHTDSINNSHTPLAKPTALESELDEFVIN
jgi:uncharacterized protein